MMAALDRIIDGVREVLRMGDDMKRLSDSLKSLATEVREIDRRLVRIETMVELAGQSPSRRAPKKITRLDC